MFNVEEVVGLRVVLCLESCIDRDKSLCLKGEYSTEETGIENISHGDLLQSRRSKSVFVHDMVVHACSDPEVIFLTHSG